MIPIDLHTFLRTRRSIRRFKPDPVPDSVIREILITATYAPSAHNRQPWRFVIVTDPGAKSSLSADMTNDFRRDLEKEGVASREIEERIRRSHERILSAPVVIIQCMDMTEMDEYPDESRRYAEFVMATQSVANAGLQLLLAAHAEGLGGVWICSPLFAQDVVKSSLDLRDAWTPQAMFLIGYSLEHPNLKPRKPLNEIVKTIS